VIYYVMIASIIYTEKTILQRDLKFCTRYRSENNFIGSSK